MARVFISYSRKNIDFTRRLTEELEKHDLDFWVDWEGIPPTVDWMKEIQRGIEEADAFLFIISSDSIASKVCREELELAIQNGKRLIPVVPYEIKWDDVPSALSHLNYIFFRETDDFNLALDKLLTAINTDYEWAQIHRRLQIKALEWERSDREQGFLLRGKDLEDAEQQIFINANKDPHPTNIQREYVLKSRQGSTRQRRITTGILVGLIAGMLGIIALLVKPYVEDAIAKVQAQKLSTMITVPAGSIDFYLVDGTRTIDLPAFYIEMQPVTNKVYGLCVKVDKCAPPVGSADFNDQIKEDDPVVWVTIAQAATYCKWVGRRLPSAPEWEQAVGEFTDPSLDESFALSTHYEWTSSYLTETSPGLLAKWDENPGNLNIVDWFFLQEYGSVNSDNSLEMYTNPSGAFGANADLGFRCANN